MSVSACNSPTCAATVEGRASVCPKCGGPMRYVGESVARGWLLIVTGGLLVLMMGAITLMMAPTLLNAGQEIDGSSWRGTAEQAQLVLALFVSIIAFGAVTAIGGIVWVKTGAKSQPLTILGFVLLAVLLIIVVVTMRAIKADGG